jgi:hypothetical protein
VSVILTDQTLFKIIRQVGSCGRNSGHILPVNASVHPEKLSRYNKLIIIKYLLYKWVIIAGIEL